MKARGKAFLLMRPQINAKQKPKVPPYSKIDSRQGTFSLGKVDTYCKAF